MKKAITTSFILIMLISGATALVGMIAGAVSVGAIAGGLGVCTITAGDCLEISDSDDIVGATPDELQNNIYGDGLFREDNRERAVKQVEDFSNQSYGVSMGQAKAVGYETMNNGSSKTLAYQRIQEQINRFYAQYEIGLLEERNVEALQFNKSVTEVRNSDNLEFTDVFTLEFRTDQGNTITDSSNIEASQIEVVETTHTTVNGTEMAEYIPKITFDCGYGAKEQKSLYSSIGDYQSNMCAPTKIIAKDTDGDTTDYVVNKDYSDAWNAIDSNRVRAIDNVNKVIDEVYNNYEPGELDVSEMLTPIEVLQTASTSYGDTGYYSYATLSLDYMGLSTNKTYAFKLRWNNTDTPEKEAVGQLYIDEQDFDNVTIEKGKTYDASNRKAYFIYGTGNGESTTVELDNTFEVLNMTNTDTGEQVNETGVQKTSITTESTEDLQKQFNELQEDYEKLKSQGPIGGAIGDLTGWLNQLFPSLPELNDSIVGLGLAALIGVLLLFA